MQQHDIPELTPDEELDRTRVLPDPVDPLEGSARLPELRPENEPGPEDEPEVPQEPKRRGRVVRKIVKYFLFLVLAVAIVAAGGIGYLTVTEYRPAYAEDAQRGNVLREGKLTGGQTVRVLTLNTGYGGLDAGALTTATSTSSWTAARASDRPMQRPCGRICSASRTSSAVRTPTS